MQPHELDRFFCAFAKAPYADFEPIRRLKHLAEAAMENMLVVSATIVAGVGGAVIAARFGLAAMINAMPRSAKALR